LQETGLRGRTAAGSTSCHPGSDKTSATSP
jgi:hypothetical protein